MSKPTLTVFPGTALAIAAMLLAVGQPASTRLPGATAAAAEVEHAELQIGRRSDTELLAHLKWLREQGRYLDAADEARTALDAMESEGRGSGAEAASVIDHLVGSLLALKTADSPEVLALARRALAVRELDVDGDAALIASAVFSLARVYGARNEIDKALDLATQGLTKLESAEGFSRSTAADGRRVIGELHMANGDFGEARSWLEDAVTILTGMEVPEPAQLAETLLPLGFSLRALGALDEAKSTINRAMDLYTLRFGAAHPDVGRSLTFLGQAQRDSGQLQDAKSSLERSVAVLAQAYGDDSPQLASPLNALALTLLDLGEYLDASSSFNRAISIQRNSGGADRNLYLATMLSNYGILCARLGSDELALQMFEESAHIAENVLGPDHPSVAYPTANRGVLLAEMGRYDEAYPLIARGLNIRAQAYGPDSLEVAHSLLHFAVYYQGIGDIAAAEDYALRALRIKEKLLPEQHIELAKIEESRSQLAHDRGDIATSLQLAYKALSIHEAALGPAALEVARGRLWIAYLLARQQDFAASLEQALQGEDIGRENAAIMFRGLAEGQALDYAGSRANGLDLLITIATQQPACCAGGMERVFDRIIRARALVSDEMIRRRSLAWQVSDAEGRALAAAFGETARVLAQLTLNGAREDDAADGLRRLAEAQEQHRQAELALADYSERFRAEVRYERVGHREVVAALPPAGALVAYIRYTPEDLAPASVAPAGGEPPAYYAAFIQAAGSEAPLALRLAEARAIDAAVASLQDLVAQEAFAAGRSSARSERRFRDSAGRLRSLVWDPVAAHLGDDVNTVLVVPDGALNFVNFAALPDIESGYLAEAGPVFHYLSSERDIVPEPRAAVSGRLLAVGAPDYEERALFAALADRWPANPPDRERPAAAYRGPRSACERFGSMRFDPLPASSREVTDIVDIWQQPPGGHGTAVVMTGALASERAFKQAAAGNRVLHLATHGFFIGRDCAPDAGAAADSLPGTENHLLLAGLVLAGANHRNAAGLDEEDGILTAEEIGTLDLRGTEWSVLSACDTGIGEFRDGEGVFGLRRAFRMAGARTTIMSLWAVEDESAREWMTALYRHHFANGADTLDSVRQASVDVLQRRRADGLSTHPYYWAGFVASGDWRWATETVDPRRRPHTAEDTVSMGR